ncbi:barstar family protein [Pedobacter lusitanus]|uniref:barstar family protein n=1 Tax=Pedobacter lusitanus TaxID=1503925 RepID=UPI000696A7C2|nr:barstar family protein [Pedobacter lusitanus]
MNGFCLFEAGKEKDLIKDNTRIVQIDGREIVTVDEFIHDIAGQLDFPDYYSSSLDSLEELLNDLSWLKESGFAIIVRNYSFFLCEEKNLARKANLLALLNDVAEQWDNVPNYPGEEDFRNKAVFNIYVEKGSAAVSELEKLKINYSEAK